MGWFFVCLPTAKAMGCCTGDTCLLTDKSVGCEASQPMDLSVGGHIWYQPTDSSVGVSWEFHGSSWNIA
jgi:hypothetical protein